ncbi:MULTISPECIES: DUF3054 domain-containing protein [Arthrobacter]|uniref:DUF3054 domain-containing protein n=1 Tax=Arthrobacter oryzae TaxID=409290 RepID=A0A3N0C5Y9_9MICC|nr:MULTISPECIES: DUF3054 domain-containing protein [Arthrobacter]QYF90179.1 DUF3054 domain-containing protein [Arthrobacter sp. PAMC25284]RNL58354.1 DUF3054 domain-containing protein [Arthrobacter oryzae]
MPSPTDPALSTTGKPAARNTAFAGVSDALMILLFAGIGRDAHARGDIITGIFATAWPFLAGAAVSWLAVRVWRNSFSLWPAGVAVWLGTVAIGMLLRAAAGQTVVLPFVIVALLSLGFLLLGWRLAAAGRTRFRARRRRV